MNRLVAAFWASFLRGFLSFRLPSISRSVCRMPNHYPPCLRSQLCELLKIYVLAWETYVYEERFHSISMISLKNDLVILGCSSACTKCLQFLGKFAEILVFIVNAFYHSRRLSPLSRFPSYLHPLLFLANFSADTDVLRESTCWTDLCHIAQEA